LEQLLNIRKTDCLGNNININEIMLNY